MHASPLWQLARCCELTLSGSFSMSFPLTPSPVAESFPWCACSKGTLLGKVFRLFRAAPYGSALQGCSRDMLWLYQRMQRMPALSALCSSTDSNCGDSKDEARCSSLRALCALAVLGQWDSSGSESWTGMQQRADVCWNNSSFSSLVYFVWMSCFLQF